jgi:sugar/nucleoside kinase (ribokinase family)
MLKKFVFFLLFSGSLFADGKVLGVGSCIMDLLVQVDDTFVQEYVGGKGGSYLCDAKHFDQILKKIPSTLKTCPGGSAGNTVRALAKLGVPCAFSSYVGEDDYGNAFCQEMDKLHIGGVHKTREFSTICILCLVTPDGERTFLHAHKTKDWDEVPREEYNLAKWAHFESFLLWDAPQFLEVSLQLAHKSGAIVSFDLSNFRVVQTYREKLLDWLDKYIDVVFCNEEEMIALTGLSSVEGFSRMQELCSIAVVTRGAKGCMIGQAGQWIEAPPFPAEVVDTTGAGDYFTAGFIYGYLKGHSLFDCARIGNRMGGAIIEVVGTNLPEEKWNAIKGFLKYENL